MAQSPLIPHAEARLDHGGRGRVDLMRVDNSLSMRLVKRLETEYHRASLFGGRKLKPTLIMMTATVALVGLSQPLHAADIGEKTACGIVVASFDRKESVPEIVTTIKNVMETLDETHTDAGEQGVLAPLTDQGMMWIVISAIEDCRNHPRKQLRDAASQSYMGLRAMQQMLGGR